MPKKQQNEPAVVYQTVSGAIQLRGDFKHQNIWASLDQIAAIFGRDKSVISRHLSNIYRDRELDRRATVAKIATVQKEGSREVFRDIEHYNLDAILSIGYRVNSKTATHFRQWATKTLRHHITRGYTINRKHVRGNYEAFMRSVVDMQALLPTRITLDPGQVLDLVKEFASTWVSLDAYDKESLKPIGATKKSVRLHGGELAEILSDFRSELIKRGDATQLFAQEKTQGSVSGIVGNIMQSFDGKPVYPSVEEKAAHLLYFMVKDHPFIDGNKRSGAFVFIWFLRKARAKKSQMISPPTLTTLTLLIAESDPRKKDQMIALITQLLR